MKSNLRIIALAVLLVTGSALVITFTTSETQTPLSASLAPAFQLLGTPIKSIDHLVTRIIPISDLDERDLGLVLRARYDSQVNATDSTYNYLNDMMKHLSKDADKPFDYKVYELKRTTPNAMALPGGVILVTSGLLKTLRSESELASVLAHEIGHIELGHCVDAVKFKLLADKLGARNLGEITDFAVRLFLSHSFSKSQENAADEFAYNLMLASPYDPRGTGKSYTSLLDYTNAAHPGASSDGKLNPFRDYFSSHPPLALRAAKFDAKAEAWWRRNSDAVRYEGKDNLSRLISIYQERSIDL